MGRTANDAAAVLAIDVCPVCTSSSVRVAEQQDWFTVQLDRSDELRVNGADAAPEFACRDCGEIWH
jgi:hypothetical protein